MKITRNFLLTQSVPLLLGFVGPVSTVGSGIAHPRPAVESAETDQRVREILRERRSEAELLESLVALGPAAIPELFRIQSGQAVVRNEGGEGEVLVDPVRETRLSLEALLRLPVPAVLEHLQGLAGRGETAESRLATLRLAGRLADARALPCVLGVLERLEPASRRGGQARREATRALRSILAADPGAMDELRRCRLPADEAWVPMVLEALEEAEPEGSVELLLRFVQRCRLNATRALELLARRVAREPWSTSTDVAGLVRPLLVRGDAEQRALGAALSAELHDVLALEPLLELLEDPVERVADRARRALTSLTGVDRGPAPSAWRTWLVDEERRWEDARARLDELRDAEGPRRLAAARELASFALRRQTVAAALVETLDGEAPYVARALGVLEGLGVRSSAPDVIRLLDHADPEVRAAAWRCLRRLTEKELPADSATWRAWMR